MRRFLILLILSLVALSAVACSDDADKSGEPGENNAGADVAEDVAPDAAERDAAEGDATSGSCVFQQDCAGAEELCFEGACVEAPTCRGVDNWSRCVREFEELAPGFGRRAVCDGEAERCRAACLLDEHCPEGDICSDDGHCVEFTGEITGDAPGSGERAPLQAGVSNVLMNFPIGLSQGGYGSRMATDEGRYVESLQASAGQMHGMYARAFVLDNGERQLLFLRLPTVFPSMALHEALARKLQEMSGKDWRDSLVLSATHTHSGPTRYWQLPTGAMLPMGMFGTDEFSQEVFDWTLETTFEAAKAALDDLAPARFGWRVVESFDTDDVIASDRWKETPPFDDNRALLFRIDDAEGAPRALVMSYGSHGTVHSGRYLTGDAPAGAERGVERALAEEFGEYVPVMFLSANGGTMSPRGDRWGHKDSERFEALGAALAERLMPAVRELETSDELELDAVTHRFPITYETIGYGPEEWKIGRSGRGTPNDVFDFGALNCLGEAGDDDPATYFTPPVSLGCLPVHELNYHRPVSLFARSQTTALQIGELTMITLPGEASMEIGWQVARDARDAFGLDPLKTWVMGYAQDHQFYLTPTNLRGELPVYPGISTPKAPDEYPDFAFSWLQGGYEAGLSVWGWRFGDFIVARALEGVSKLVGGSVEPAFDEPLPLEYSRAEEPAFPVESSDPERVGEVLQEPAAKVARMEPVELAWVGGDPGAEMPQAPLVALTRRVSDGSFEPVFTSNLRPYDNREPLMLTRVREVDGEWQWVVYWEETQDFPLGHYRFEVKGHYQDAAGDRVGYEVKSRAFELRAREDLVVEVEAADDEPAQLGGTLGYPPGERLEFDEDRADLGKISGNFRMRHPRVALGDSAPLIVGEDIEQNRLDMIVRDAGSANVVSSLSNIDLSTAEESVNGREGVPVTRFSVDLAHSAVNPGPGSYDVEFRVSDVWGNTGVGSLEVTLD